LELSKELQSDETIKRERKLQTYLGSLKKSEQMDEETCKLISTCDSRAGIMYALPKIHKDGVPVRPIISACGTYNYKLA